MELHPNLRKYLDLLKRQKPEPAPIPADPVEPLRYSDFEAGSLKMCCKVILHGIKGNMTHIEYSFKKPFEGISEYNIEITNCPGCGRKLK